MKKYGLQLRAPTSQQKKQPARLPLSSLGFSNDDDDDVEKEISRHATKNKALKDIEEQHRKALEDDPSVFDYDGVYDEMKEKVILPVAQDRQERKPKYIQKLIEKAKEREREHEVIYEKKLAKERSKDDHLFADKDKFVTGAYKRKLAEQAKWLEEERRRQLKEEKDDVTKKSDISDFYFNLSKNVAFGAKDAESRKSQKQPEEVSVDKAEKSHPEDDKTSESLKATNEHQGDSSAIPYRRSESVEPKSSVSMQEKPVAEPAGDEPRSDHHKRNDDAVSAAKERFLARKRAKEQ